MTSFKSLLLLIASISATSPIGANGLPGVNTVTGAAEPIIGKVTAAGNPATKLVTSGLSFNGDLKPEDTTNTVNDQAQTEPVNETTDGSEQVARRQWYGGYGNGYYRRQWYGGYGDGYGNSYYRRQYYGGYENGYGNGNGYYRRSIQADVPAQSSQTSKATNERRQWYGGYGNDYGNNYYRRQWYGGYGNNYGNGYYRRSIEVDVPAQDSQISKATKERRQWYGGYGNNYYRRQWYGGYGNNYGNGYYRRDWNGDYGYGDHEHNIYDHNNYGHDNHRHADCNHENHGVRY